jgi:hypothetical protein
MRILTLFVLSLILLAKPVLAEDKPTTPAAETAPSLVEQFQERNPKTVAVLASDFPDDYRVLLTQLDTIEATGQSQMVQLNASFDALRQIRKKYADRMSFAPPALLADVLTKLADFYEDVLKQDGAAVCGKFAQDGSGVLFQLARSDAYVERLDAQSAAYLEAVVGAIETPETYGAADKNDYPKVLAIMVRAGAPESYVAAIANGNGADPNLCPALAAMFRTVALSDAAEAVRMRPLLGLNAGGY